MAYTAIDDPEAYFQAKKWAGNNDAGGQAITLDGDTDLQPDFVWVKSHDEAHSHVLYDSVRTSPAKYFVKSDANIAERTAVIGSFDSDGVTWADSDGFYNGSDNYVGWFWKESATAGFDIVAMTGTGSARTQAHSLSAVPHVVMVKNRDAADAWSVYHHANTSAPETDYLVLNTTAATADAADRWNDTAPTSSVFSLGDGDEVNTNTEKYIAYLFTPIQGFSKFGSYVGNGDADGPFVYTGFRPAFILIKVTSDASGWSLQDNKRTPFNVSGRRLLANSANAEIVDAAVDIDFLSNGFKIRNNDTDDNGDGRTHIFMAFAEAPFVNSNGVPCNAR